MHLKYNSELLHEFIEEINESIDQIQVLLASVIPGQDNIESLNELFRLYHSLKGAFGFIELEPLIQFCHNIEHVLDSIRNNQLNSTITVIKQLQYATDLIFSAISSVDDHDSLCEKVELIDEFASSMLDLITNKPQNLKNPKLNESLFLQKIIPNNIESSSLRIELSAVNKLINYIGELVLVRNRLTKISTNVNDENLFSAVTNLEHIVTTLQNATLDLRMQPISRLFKRYSRLIKNLSDETEKEIQLIIHGEDTKLDKNLLEILVDPITHLVRNCVDHGIESPEIRSKIGKKAEGRITLSAFQEGENVFIKVEDDGVGIDPAVLKKKAHDKGIMDIEKLDQLSHEEALNLIFTPGFSTCNTISSISGRGVGMDVVRHRIHQVNGSIEVSSSISNGSKFLIKVPMTLAIINTLMFYVDSQIYAIPVNAINEILNFSHQSIKKVDHFNFLHYRANIIPLYFLHESLNMQRNLKNNETEMHIIILNIGTQSCGVVVDQVIGQEEVVVKPLSKNLPEDLGIFGATTTADGSVAMVLDITTITSQSKEKKLNNK